eukprot:1294331-Pleurochrysis_carterae.AAC.1
MLKPQSYDQEPEGTKGAEVVKAANDDEKRAPKVADSSIFNISMSVRWILSHCDLLDFRDETVDRHLHIERRLDPYLHA